MDDVTIEDEDQFNEEISSESENKSSLVKWSFILNLLNENWTIFLVLLIVILIFIYLNVNQRRNRNSSVGFSNSEHRTNVENVSEHSINRYNDVERIREKQQKAYEEQALRYAEQKKAKMESCKPTTDEKPNPSKYRPDDYNPLTGQSNRGSGDSCSWRPSSRKRGTGG